MQNNKNSKDLSKSNKSSRENLPHVSANETFVLATDGKRDPVTNITLPPDQDVEAARKFVIENKK